MSRLTDTTRRRIGLGIIALTMSLVIAESVLAVANGPAGRLIEMGGVGGSFGVVLVLAIRAVPRNSAVWVMIWAAFFGILGELGGSVGLARAGITGAQLENLEVTLAPSQIDTLAAFGLSLNLSMWVPGVFLLATHLLILFPSGRAVNRTWRRVAWVSAVSMALMTAAAVIRTGPWVDEPYNEILGDDLAAGPLGLLIMPLMLIALASVVHLIRRYRASSGEERLQYRWITWALALNVANIFAFTWTNEVVSSIALASIPVAFGIALTRYRLYNIDVVVSRTVTYGALAAFITGVYALVVVGVGSLVGSRDEPNLGLSIAAVALVAVVFEPLRSRLQRWANRLVYGDRATPYEVLARATSRLAGSTTPEETLKTVSQLVVDGTGAAGAVLWIRVGEALQPYSATPREAIAGLAPVPTPDDALPDLPGDASVPVRHHDDLLGALSIIKPRGQSVTGADEKVLADVAAGSGLLLRNITLNAELTERAAQLRASRRRLVAAHDTERHRLERDLHDGAQQQVVALKVKLGIARTLAEREGAADIAALASSLAEQVQQTVDAMRSVAHGIYPPLLEAEGLQAALTASARSVPIPVDVAADGLGRYPRDIEETAYFCVIDALEAARLSGAKGARVELTDREDRLTLEIDHDGRATTTNSQAITDRVEAFDGTAATEIAEGTGSRTTIRLPIPQPAPVPT